MDQQQSPPPPAPGNPVIPQQAPLAPNPMVTAAPVTPNANQSQGKSKSMYIVIGAILVILVIGGGLLFITSHHAAPVQPMMAQKTPPTQAPAITGVPTPVISPVTAQNVDQTLSNTDSKMQQAVNQANSDLNNISTINASQDSTSGL